jgi:UDP-glucuronate 4-epimerase
VLRAAHLANVRTVVLTSSSSVYGNRQDARAFREDDPLESPESPYAASKRAAEDLAALLRVPTACASRRRVCSPCTVRASDRTWPSRVPPRREDATRSSRSSGTARRRATTPYVDDAVAGLLAAAAYAGAREPGMRIWNLASNRPVRLLDLVATIGRVVGRSLKVRHERGSAATSVTRGVISLAPAPSSATTPAVDLETGILRQWLAGD